MKLAEKKEWIEKAKAAGACEESIQYIEENIKTIEFDGLNVDAQLWAIGSIDFPVTDERFNKLGNENPWHALTFCNSRMTDEQLERWGNIAPWHALKYCNSRMTDEQRERFERLDGEERCEE